MIPLTHAAMPDDVAKAALFFASDDSKPHHLQQPCGRRRLVGQRILLNQKA
jgi:hypothetical protein